MAEEDKAGPESREPETASRTQELPASGEGKPASRRAPKWIAELEVGVISELGRVRENNEDNFQFLNPESTFVLKRRGSLYAVADGMGGHASGQIASELALRTFFDKYYRDAEATEAEAAMRWAYAEANAVVYATGRGISGREGMGTTLACVSIMGKQALVGNVGDSRVYLMRAGAVKQITKDHSLVGEQVRQGVLTEDEATASPFRNVITRCIGNEPTAQPDLLWQDVEPGDVFLLCSDGLSNLVTAQEMVESLQESSPSQAVRVLADRALARGAPDNVTVLIVKVKRIVRTTAASTARWRLWIKSLAAAGLGALVTLVALWQPLHGPPSPERVAGALQADAKAGRFTAAPQVEQFMASRLEQASQGTWQEQLAAYRGVRELRRAAEKLEAALASAPEAGSVLQGELREEAQQQMVWAKTLLARLSEAGGGQQ